MKTYFVKLEPEILLNDKVNLITVLSGRGKNTLGRTDGGPHFIESNFLCRFSNKGIGLEQIAAFSLLVNLLCRISSSVSCSA